MKLKEIEFNTVFCAPGTFGYFGEKNSIFFKAFFGNVTFVSQTMTVFPYEQPTTKIKKIFRNIFQSSNKLSKLGAGVVLSKEDISGPGLEKLLEKGIWQKKTKPFILTFVSLETSKEKRLLEMKKIMEVLQKAKKEFKTEFGIMICLNDPEDNDYDAFTDEANETLNILSLLEIPIIVQLSLSLPPDVTDKIASNKNCDAVAVNTSVSWDRFPKDAKKMFFRMSDSPISSDTGGNVFGKYLEPLAVEWARQAKKYSVGKPLIIGGGILNTKNIDSLARIGSNGFILDKATLLRFWNIPKIINRSKKIFLLIKKTNDMQNLHNEQ